MNAKPPRPGAHRHPCHAPATAGMAAGGANRGRHHRHGRPGPAGGGVRRQPVLRRFRRLTGWGSRPPRRADTAGTARRVIMVAPAKIANTTVIVSDERWSRVWYRP
jgi:hypothetical protein